MASFTGIIKTLQDLTAQTTAEDTDLIPIGTSVLKKISFANLRKALGVDALNSNLTISELTTWINVPTGTYTGGQYTYTKADAANATELIFVIQHANRGSETMFEYVPAKCPFSRFPNSYFRVVTTVGTLEFYFSGTSGTIDFVGVPAPVRQVFYRK